MASADISDHGVSGGGRADALPRVDPKAIATKFDKFVYDELNVLPAADKARLEKMLYDHAARKNVEVVVIIAKDLEGRSADEYAANMMRQLRIGKLELGNGACLVVAPRQNQVGVSLMPGLQFDIDEKRVEREIKPNLTTFLNDGLKAKNRGYYSFLDDAAKRVVDMSKHIDWAVRYNDMEAFLLSLIHI